MTTMTDQQKICKSCDTMLPLTPEYFYKYPNSEKLMISICKKCKCSKNRLHSKNNIDHKLQYQKRKEELKENIKRRQKIRFLCKCGAECSLNYKSAHLKTHKHLEYIEIQRRINEKEEEKEEDDIIEEVVENDEWGNKIITRLKNSLFNTGKITNKKKEFLEQLINFIDK